MSTELGKQFLAEIAGKLPENLRGSIDQILTSPEAQAALELVGSRVSPLDEARQRLDEQRQALDSREQRLSTWRSNLERWKGETEEAFAQREAALAKQTGRATNDPPPNVPATGAKPESAMTKAEIQKAVEDVLIPREAAYIQYVADATKYAVFHEKHFGEVLDVAALVRHEKIGELGVKGVYELVNKDRLDKMADDARKAERELIRAEVRQELVSQQPVDMPYPIGEGSPLDALNLTPEQRPKGDPVAAARMYEQLVSGAGTR